MNFNSLIKGIFYTSIASTFWGLPQPIYFNEIKFTDLELIFKDLKTLFQKKGYIINWKELEKQDLNQTINTLAMASPFSLEEKQALLETQNLISRKFKLEEIIKTYILDDFSNTTIQ